MPGLLECYHSTLNNDRWKTSLNLNVNVGWELLTSMLLARDR